MAFKELKARWNGSFPEGTPQRVKDLDALDRLRDGTIYDILPYPFSVEFEDTGSQDYIEIAQRRPSVRYDLAKIIVDETSSMAFGTGHSPYVEAYDPLEEDSTDDTETTAPPTPLEVLNKVIQYIRTECLLDAVMVEAMMKGGSGSCGVILQARKNSKPFFRVINGKFGFPKFDEDDPEKLVYLDEIYQTTSEDLLARGYTWAELREDLTETWNPDIPFMVNIRIDDKAEYWMTPLRLNEFARLGKPKDDEDPDKGVYEWEIDQDRIYPHTWNEVPAVWGRNLQERELIDGPCIYEDIADMIIEIDYLLSQTGRGFKYSMDPLLAFEKDQIGMNMPLGGAGAIEDQYNSAVDIKRTPARALRTDGQVKMLEITGNGLNASRDYIKLLREWALEVIGGMKSDQEHAGGPQSGRALEILHQALVWLVDRLRTDYGDGIMLPIIRLCLRGIQNGTVVFKMVGKDKLPADIDVPMRLIWPEWWLPRGADLFQTLQAMQIAAGGSAQEPKQMLPMETVFAAVAQAMGLPDPSRIAKKASAEFKEFREIQIEQNAPPEPKPTTSGGSS